MCEIWKDIKGYEGYYQVSNLGNIRSLNRIIVYSNDRKHMHKGKLLKLAINNAGYIEVCLQKQSSYKYMLVHRIVAEAFIPNCDNLPCVNHIDENPLNNNVDNLEWCTYSYNDNYGTRNLKISNSRKGMKFTEEHRENLSKAKQGKSLKR